MTGSWRRPARTLRSIVVWLGFGLVVFLVGALIVLPKATGAVPLTVTSGSMSPAIPAGSVVVVRPVDTGSLRVGDVITYQVRSGDPTLVSHRIVGIGVGADGTTFRTRGDANGATDPEPVRGVQVRGEVWYDVPVVGHLTGHLDGSQRAWGRWLVGGALLASSAWLIGTALRDRVRAARDGDSQDSSRAGVGP